MVAHKILETAQSPNSSFPFLFDFGIGLGTWTRACDLGKQRSNRKPLRSTFFFNHSLKKAHYLKIYKCAWVLVVGSFYTFLDESKERRRELLKVYPNMICNKVHKDKSNSHITVY